MKKTNVVKILEVIIFLLVFSLVCSNKVEASEASVSANNCNVGENFTVTVTIPQDVSGYDIGGITVAYSDGSTQSAKRAVKANMDLSWPGNYTVTFPGKVAGNATISVNNIILVNSSQSVVNSNSTLETSITITDSSNTTQESNSDSTSSSEVSATSTPVILNFKDTNEKMYTNRRVNVRQNYGTDSGIIQTLAVGTEVVRTGISDGSKNGYSWSRISYNGITGYVITGALTYDEPVKPEEDVNANNVEENEQDEVNKEDNNQDVTEISDDDKAKISAISEELGVIPEVGMNIMPFMFLGSCAVCLIIVSEMKIKMIE